MAIDTAQKRKAISGVILLLPGVTPNASKDAAWRKASAWNYFIELAGLRIVKICNVAVSLIHL